MNLYEKLVKYSDADYYPMHMPGHKRNIDMINMVNPYGIDITEIDGFDNLHHAEGILLEGMKRAARLYGSEYTSYLVNGSTVGILAGIAACTKKGDKILVARNSHKSVYNAIYLNELNPIYIYPQIEQELGINGGLNPETMEELLINHQDIKLVVITSPTYEGIISDVKKIGEITHKYGIPLLVDEAHGAHLGFHPEFPQSSVSLGADIVIHSLHKTLPSFTQTGLIHVNGNLVDNKEVKRYLAIYQTSSPSYLLMASMDQCITLLEEKKDELFDNYNLLLHLFFNRMKQLTKIKVLNPYESKKYGFYMVDPSKVTISVKSTNFTGTQLYNRLLDKYKLQMEMVSMDYVLGMTSIFDSRDGFERLGDALLEIDKEIDMLDLTPVKPDKTGYKTVLAAEVQSEQVQSEQHIGLKQAIECHSDTISLSDSEGRVTAEYIYLYPPGIPLLVPGERISKELLCQIKSLKESGLMIQGMDDINGNYIRVVHRP